MDTFTHTIFWNSSGEICYTYTAVRQSTVYLNSNLLWMTCTSVNSDCKLLEMIFTLFLPLCRLRFPTVALWMDLALLRTTKLVPILWTSLAHLTETGKFFFFSDPVKHFSLIVKYWFQYIAEVDSAVFIGCLTVNSSAILSQMLM